MSCLRRRRRVADRSLLHPAGTEVIHEDVRCHHRAMIPVEGAVPQKCVQSPDQLVFDVHRRMSLGDVHDPASHERVGRRSAVRRTCAQTRHDPSQQVPGAMHRSHDDGHAGQHVVCSLRGLPVLRRRRDGRSREVGGPGVHPPGLRSRVGAGAQVVVHPLESGVQVCRKARVLAGLVHEALDAGGHARWTCMRATFLDRHPADDPVSVPVVYRLGQLPGTVQGACRHLQSSSRRRGGSCELRSLDLFQGDRDQFGGVLDVCEPGPRDEIGSCARPFGTPGGRMHRKSMISSSGAGQDQVHRSSSWGRRRGR